MNEELLAGPKLGVRAYGKLVGVYCALAACAEIVLAAVGMYGVATLIVRLAATAAFGGAAIWVYAKLMEAAKRTPAERAPLFYGVVIAMGMVAFLGAGTVVLAGTRLGMVVSGNWWMAPFMGGIMFAVGALQMRVGESLHCPACEYEFGFSGEESPERCAECGTAWLGKLKKGKRTRSWRLFAVGIAVAVGAMAISMLPFYMASIVKQMPTSALFVVQYLTPSNNYKVWDEFAARPLDAWSVRTMAERLLNRRKQDPYDLGSAKWLEMMIAAGKLPKELTERFYREGFEAELIAPARAKAGTDFTVCLRVRRAVSGWGDQLGVMFGGYCVDGRREALGRRDQTIWRHEISVDVFAAHRDVLGQKIHAERRGEMRVRVVYWVVYEPSFMDELVWRPGGFPAPPARARWFQKVEMEKTVLIE